MKLIRSLINGNKLRVTSELYITQINSLDVTSSKAIVTLCRIGAKEFEFETPLRFPIYARVVCRFILPHPEGALHLDAVVTRGTRIQGLYRYRAVPLLNDAKKSKLAGVISYQLARMEKLIQRVSKSYVLLDPEQQNKSVINQVV